MSILKEKKNREIIQEINEKIKPRRFEDIVIRSKGHPRFAMYINTEMNQTDVSDLDLTVRSYNCLKRAGFDTVGKLVEGIGGYQDLLRMRNLGKNSAEEIMIKLFLYQYTHLKPERQVRFLNRFEELN